MLVSHDLDDAFVARSLLNFLDHGVATEKYEHWVELAIAIAKLKNHHAAFLSGNEESYRDLVQALHLGLQRQKSVPENPNAWESKLVEAWAGVAEEATADLTSYASKHLEKQVASLENKLELLKPLSVWKEKLPSEATELKTVMEYAEKSLFELDKGLQEKLFREAQSLVSSIEEIIETTTPVATLALDAKGVAILADAKVVLSNTYTTMVEATLMRALQMTEVPKKKTAIQKIFRDLAKVSSNALKITDVQKVVMCAAQQAIRERAIP